METLAAVYNPGPSLVVSAIVFCPSYDMGRVRTEHTGRQSRRQPTNSLPRRGYI